LELFSADQSTRTIIRGRIRWGVLVKVINSGIDEKVSGYEFGSNETMLGVGVNRVTQKLEGLEGTTSVYYNDAEGTVMIDVEKDPLLQQLLGALQINEAEEGSLKTASEVVKAVVDLTPEVDTTGNFHSNRAVSLGEALSNPVECVDRALAFEAALKVFGITDARMLISVDRHPTRPSENHADTIFSVAGIPHVAITMGQMAGQALTFKEYSTNYINEREKGGLGRREIRQDWGHEYFQSIG